MTARILVVDDDRDNADSLSRLVGLMGYEAMAVYNGEEAIAISQGVCPEMVFIDLGMPGMDGYETATRIRQLLGSQTILVAVTGWSRPEDRRRAACAGFDLHYAKPLSLAALEQLLAIPAANTSAAIGAVA
jgi:CheY-like chemotaxis protein